MNPSRVIRVTAIVVVIACSVHAQQTYVPEVGQEGKDVVWVPTPHELIEKMLDLARVTPQDVVMDLGSGDGRNVIAAAKRGARAIGVEYNPDMVALSRRLAAESGVADRATFIEGDMFTADFSNATVLALFLLPNNLERLRDKFLELKPGTRIVLNTFGISGWEADVTETISGSCTAWCKALLLVVPARAAGTWELPQGELTLTQQFQMISGTLASEEGTLPVTQGRLLGNEIAFTAGETGYTGRVVGDRMEGSTFIAGVRQDWVGIRRNQP